MISDSQIGAVRRFDTDSVERIRILACLLLVTYHVIGMPSSGLKLDSPGPLRIFADILGDFRMPAFAFVAGFVYALRSPDLPHFGTFIVGRFKRLAIPGVIAILAFDMISALLGMHWALPLDRLWQVLVFPYAHYWFLQSLLVILVVVGLVDAATRGRAELPLLAIAVVVSLIDPPTTNLFSVNSALRLAPFFLTGVCFWRHKPWIERHVPSITALAIIAIVFWAGWTLAELRATGTIATGNRQAQAILLGISACALLLFFPPPIPASRAVGQYTFTIYLYHVLGTAGMRTLLLHLGVQSLAVHLVLGIAAGVVLPVALHRWLLSWPLGARFVLGVKSNKAAVPRLREPVYVWPVAVGGKQT